MLTYANSMNFFLNRQTSVWNKKLKQRGSAQLDCDFLMNRFACKESDMHVVQGSLGEVPPFTCKFGRDSCGGNKVLAVATEEGEILILDAESTHKELVLHSWTAHKNAVFDICWVPGKPLLLTGSGDHTVGMFDAFRGDRIAVFMKHSATVKCLDVCPSQPAVFASGSRDGSIHVWDMRVAKLCHAGHADKQDIIISDAHTHNLAYSADSPRRRKIGTSVSTKLRSVTSIAFQDEYNLASAGVADQTVKLWDLRKTYVVNQKTAPIPKHAFFYGGIKSLHGCSCLQFDSTFSYLFACCTDNTVLKFDCRSYSSQALSTYYGFKASSYFVKMAISPDDQYIVCGSGDEKAYIWKVSQPGAPVACLSGHSAEVTAVHWHPSDITKLATCSDDNTVMMWKVFGSNEDFGDSSFIGSSKLIEKGSISANVCKINTTSTREVSFSNLKERSLIEFFPRTSHYTSQSVNHKVQASSENKENGLKPSKSSVLQPVTNILVPHNKKRRLSDSATENVASLKSVTEESQKTLKVGDSVITNCVTVANHEHSSTKDTDGKENCDLKLLHLENGESMTPQKKTKQCSSPPFGKQHRSPPNISCSIGKSSPKVRNSQAKKQTERPITSYFQMC